MVAYVAVSATLATTSDAGMAEVGGKSRASPEPRQMEGHTGTYSSDDRQHALRGLGTVALAGS